MSLKKKSDDELIQELGVVLDQIKALSPEETDKKFQDFKKHPEYEQTKDIAKKAKKYFIIEAFKIKNELERRGIK